MNEFNPNRGKCGMLNSRGFCSLTACQYPSNVIVAEPKVIRGMMVNPQIEKPMTHFDEIKAMNVEELADYLRWHNDSYSRYGMDWLDWLKAPVEVKNAEESP